MKVLTWMTPRPQLIRPDDTLDSAKEKMVRGRFRRLPVVDKTGALVGIITERDLRQHEGFLSATRVTGAMVENPITVDPQTPIEVATGLMLKHKIGGLPVVSNTGELLGIITETDLLQGFLRGLSGGEESSGRIDFHFTTPEQTFADAVAVIERAGGTILGLGTLQARGEEAVRTFYLRVLSPDVGKLAEALRERGYSVQAVHPAA